MPEQEKIAEGFKGEKAIVTPYNIREYQRRNEITCRFFVTHIGYYPLAKNHLRVRKGGANENILIYCEKGKGWVEHAGERYKLTAHQLFIIPAGDSHSYGADNKDPWSIYWLHFSGKDVHLFNSVIGHLITLNESDNSRYHDRFDLIESIYKNLEMGYSPENLEYISFCLMHLLASVKYLSQYRELKTVKVDDVIQKSILFMKENLENKISLDDIANAVGYSRSHFITLFTKKHYILRWYIITS